MPGASVAVLPPTTTSTPTSRKASLAPERKYKCQFCHRAFSRSEHRSRHERSRKSTLPIILSSSAPLRLSCSVFWDLFKLPSIFPFFRGVERGVEGKKTQPLSAVLSWTEAYQTLQIRKNAPSSASSVGALSFDEIFFSAMTVPFMPKMAASLCIATASVEPAPRLETSGLPSRPFPSILRL